MQWPGRGRETEEQRVSEAILLQPPKLCEEEPQLVKLRSPYVSEAEAAHRFTGAQDRSRMEGEAAVKVKGSRKLNAVSCARSQKPQVEQSQGS